MRFTILIISALLLSVGNLLADTPSPKAIFSKDYAKSPTAGDSMEPSITQNGATPRTIGSSKLPKISGEKTNEKDSSKTTDFVSLGEDPKEAEKKETKEIENNVPLTSLALVLNGSEPVKDLTSIRLYTDLVVEHEIQPDAVHFMDPTSQLLKKRPADFDKLLIRGARIKTNRSIGKKYGITRVPAWIVQTEQGHVVLEGYETIGSFINSKGELRLTKVRKQAKRFSKEAEEKNQNPAIKAKLNTSKASKN